MGFPRQEYWDGFPFPSPGDLPNLEIKPGWSSKRSGTRTHSSVLAWRIPGTGEPGGLTSMGSHRVGHDWSNLAAAAAALWEIPLVASLVAAAGKESACNAGDPGSIPGSGSSPGERIGYLLQYSCLENPTDGGAWWAAVYGVAQSWTQLKRLSSNQGRGRRQWYPTPVLLPGKSHGWRNLVGRSPWGR